MSETTDRLWTARDLARFLVYSESTVARMVSQEPEKLPPRVAGLGRPRWDTETVRRWVAEQSQGRGRGGRPRRAV